MASVFDYKRLDKLYNYQIWPSSCWDWKRVGPLASEGCVPRPLLLKIFTSIIQGLSLPEGWTWSTDWYYGLIDRADQTIELHNVRHVILQAEPVTANNWGNLLPILTKKTRPKSTNFKKIPISGLNPTLPPAFHSHSFAFLEVTWLWKNYRYNYSSANSTHIHSRLPSCCSPIWHLPSSSTWSYISSHLTFLPLPSSSLISFLLLTS